MPRVNVQTFNNLFGMLANQEVNVKRSNKAEGDRNNYQVINKWNDPYSITLRGRATFEENLLVAGKLAHPQLRDTSEVISASLKALVDKRSASGKEKLTDVGHYNLHDALVSSIGSFEFARGAMVSAQHYSNKAIQDVSFNALVKEVSDPKTAAPYYSAWIKTVQPNLVARLLGKPATLAESYVDVSGITPLSLEDIKDENLRATFGRFVLELVDLLDSIDHQAPVTPPETEFTPDEDEDEQGDEVTSCTNPESFSDEDEDEAEDGDEQGGQGEEDEEDEEDEAEGQFDGGSKAGDNKPEDADDLKDSIDKAIDRAVQKAEDELAKSQVEETGINLGATKEADELEESALRMALQDHAFVNKEQAYLHEAPDMSDIAPPEDIGDLNRKSSGLLTSDAWKISLGNTKVFESSDEGEPQNLLILADCSGSTTDKVLSNKYDLGTVSQVIWALAGQLLKVTPNSKSYGFTGGYGGEMTIVEGQTAGMMPNRRGSGGTPTIQALRWATEQANEESVICLITDDGAERGSGLYVRQLADQGHRIATILVPSPRYATRYLGNPQARLAEYGSDMACIYDVSSEASNKALQDMFANLLV